MTVAERSQKGLPLMLARRRAVAPSPEVPVAPQISDIAEGGKLD